MAQKLFDKASLVMIPSQYKEGKVYNIKPEDQSSSFEFERGSAATRVNSSGLIEQVGVGDIESVTNSDFNTTDNWVTGSTTSSFTVTNGIATIQGDANSFNTRIGQTLSLEANKSYFIKVRIKSNDGNYWRIRGYDNITGYFDITNDNNTEFNDITYVYNAPSGMNGVPILYISSYFQNGTTDFSVDFASVKEINTDTPRLDYSGTEPALLLEPQRTNVITTSQGNGSIWGWGSDAVPNNTTRLDNQPSISGNNDAFLFTRNEGTTGWFGFPNISVTSGLEYTYSIFIKPTTTTEIKLNLVSFQPQPSVVYSFESNSFTTENNATGKIQSLANGWYRISMIYTNGFTANQIRHTLSDGGSAYVFGGQLEQGSYATSYIPTNGQTETRLADDSVATGLGSIAGQSEGTLFAYFKTIGDSATPYISLNKNNTVGNRVLIYNNSGVSAEIRVEGVVQASITSSTQGLIKAAFAYKANDFAFYINGSQIGTDSSGITFSAGVLNELNLGFGAQDGAEIKQIILFPTKLTDTELQQLTSNT